MRSRTASRLTRNIRPSLAAIAGRPWLPREAQTQRVLWASTSTKNPAYRDVLYVEELIGPDTVDTIPPATLDAFRDHGKPRASLTENVDAAHRTMETVGQSRHFHERSDRQTHRRRSPPLRRGFRQTSGGSRKEFEIEMSAKTGLQTYKTARGSGRLRLRQTLTIGVAGDKVRRLLAARCLALDRHRRSQLDGLARYHCRPDRSCRQTARRCS